MQTLEKETKETPATHSVSREDYNSLAHRIRQLEGRLRMQEAVRLLPFGIIVGGLVGLAIAIYSRLTPSLTVEQVTLAAVVAVGLGVAGVLLYAFVRRRKLIKTARQIDLALGLHERLSTAVEGYQSPDALGYEAMGHRQFEDARQAAENLKVGKALPLRMTWRSGLLALAILPLLALALLLPNPFSDDVKSNQAIKNQIQQEAQKIEDLKEKIQKEHPDAAKTDPKTADLLKELEKTKQALLEKSDNKDEALASLQAAQQELEKLNDPNKSTAEKAAIESLAKTLNSADQTKPAGQALQQPSQDRYDKAAQELDKLANQNSLDALKQDAAQAQQLSDKLNKDAQNFKNSNPQMSDKLQKLSDALKPSNLNQNSQAAAQAFKDLAQQIKQTGQDQKSNQDLQQAQSQLQKSEQSINQTAQKGQQNQTGKNGKPDNSNQDNSGNNTDPANAQTQQPGQDQQGQDQQGQDQGQSVQPGQQGQQPGQQGQQPGQQGQQPGQQGQQPGQQGQQPGQQGQQPGQNGQQPGQQGQNGQQPGNQGDPNQNGQSGNPGSNNAKNGSKGSKTGTSDQVYPGPTGRRTDGSQVNVQGQNGQGPNNNQTVNGGNPSGNAAVPYSDVIDSYTQQASEQLDKNYVPITLKDMVKQYFDDLNKKEK